MVKLNGKEQILFALSLLLGSGMAVGAIQNQGWIMAMFLAGCLFSLYGAGQLASLPYRRRTEAAWEGMAEAMQKLGRLSTELPALISRGEGTADGLKEPLEKLEPLLVSLGDRFESMGSEVGGSLREALSRLPEEISSHMRQEEEGRKAFIENWLERWRKEMQEREDSAKRQWLEGLAEAADSFRKSGEILVGGMAASQESVLNRAAESEARLRGNLEKLFGESRDVFTAGYRDMVESTLGRWEADLHRVLEGFSTASNAIQTTARETIEASQAVAQDSRAFAAEVQAQALAAGQASVENQAKVMEDARRLLDTQTNLHLEMAQKSEAVTSGLEQTTQRFSALIEAMEANQHEMQAGVSMLNAGLASLLEKLEARTDEKDAGRETLDELREMLGVFHEKSSEILLENSLKTREVLMQALVQSELKV